jgi:hypothetical protein
LVAGEPLRAVSATYNGVSKDGARRHLKNHISPALVRLTRQEQQDAEDGRIVLSARDRLEQLYDEAWAVLQAAKDDGNSGLTLQAIDRLDKVVDRIARISGELDERPVQQVLNLHTHPDWLRLRQAVLAALEPHPEALGAVVERVRALEG